MDRRILIGIGILALVCLGFLFFSTMTGNVITGSAVGEMVVDDEYFRISDFGGELNEEKNYDEDSGGSR